MTAPVTVSFVGADVSALNEIDGSVVLLASAEGGMDPLGRRINRLTRGAVKRALESSVFEELKIGGHLRLNYPTGLQADAVYLCKLPRRVSVGDARQAGASVASFSAKTAITILGGAHPKAHEVAFGVSLRSYTFDEHKTSDESAASKLTVMANDPEGARNKFAPMQAQTDGVFFTRDLTNEPANILTTTEFADRLVGLRSLGLEVDVLEEPDLEKLGMRALLGVGQGSASPSKVVVMRWNGGGDEAPFALVGKGVVFDTGGISLKPAAGMEDMTMDMGGAAVVAGVMQTLATRKARTNVVGLVGLVENMPDGLAQRPGDVVTSMKGDTIEVINTDAEGRLVLCDVLWHTQQEYNPSAIIDLATLTGAAIIALGHENAAVFSNNDDFAGKFLKAAANEDEGAWHMPLGAAYAKQLDSRVADLKNVGGRPAGSVTAAEFLHRFVKDDVPWIHLDIAGVASRADGTPFSPKGATGWGVRAINRLIADHYEIDR